MAPPRLVRESLPETRPKEFDLLVLMRWLQGLEENGFHGKVTLTFNGKLTYVEKHEGFKPWDALT